VKRFLATPTEIREALLEAIDNKWVTTDNLYRILHRKFRGGAMHDITDRVLRDLDERGVIETTHTQRSTKYRRVQS